MAVFYFNPFGGCQISARNSAFGFLVVCKRDKFHTHENLGFRYVHTRPEMSLESKRF